MREYTCYTEEFANIRDLVKAIEERPVNHVFQGRTLSSDSRDDRSWYLTDNFEHAKNLLFQGWDEHVSEVKAGLVELDKLLTVESMTRVTPRANFVGHAPSVPRFMYGLPNSMIDSTRQPNKQRTITILYGFGGLGHVGAETLLQSGIALLSGIAAIERLGIRVKLDAVRASYRGNEICTFRLCVKDYCQPLDLHKLCFPIANPSMQRRIAFGWLERHPEMQERGWADGYGCSLQGDYDGGLREAFDAAVLRPDEVMLFQHTIQEHDYDIAAAFAEAGITVLRDRLERTE